MTTEAYIQDSFTVPKAVYDFMIEQTATLNDDTRHLVNHVTVCTIQRLHRQRDDLFIPVSFALLRTQLKQACVQEASHLLEVRPHSFINGRCREFMPKLSYLGALVDVDAQFSSHEYDQIELVNFFTGRRVKALPKSRLYNDQKHPYPALITDAVRVLEANGCLFNQRAVELHVKRAKEIRDQAVRECKPTDKEYKKAIGRYINDHFCFRAVKQRRPAPTSMPEVYKFTPAYLVVKTGRLKQPYGGLQSCSRLMKHAAYSGVPGLRNYDLKGSQLAVVVKELRRTNLNPEWLVRYLTLPDGKHIYAERVGMPVDCWKRCLLALVMGAPLPNSTSQWIAERSAIVEEILDWAKGDLEEAETMRRGFAEVIAPLLEELNRWHKYLIRDYIQKNQRRSKKGAYVENQAGMRLYLDELNFKGNGRSAKSRLAAFLLQGQEAAFIHALTVLGPEYGFKPISNEHDGLVVIGEIPKAAERKAASQSGFENAELVEKSFL